MTSTPAILRTAAPPCPATPDAPSADVYFALESAAPTAALKSEVYVSTRRTRKEADSTPPDPF